MKIKKLFSTPKNAFLTIISLMAATAILSTGTAYAASAIAQNSSIGAENAMNFAFADAGIDPITAKEIHTEFDYEQGQFVYEVEFVADGTEYEYWINASNGSVVKKDIEIVELSSRKPVATTQITLEQAKEIALKDANLSADSVTFTAAKLDMEDSISIYEIEFYADNVEYEYEINATTAAIYSKSKEIHNEQKTASTATPGPTKAVSQETSNEVKQSNTDNSANTKTNTGTDHKTDTNTTKSETSKSQTNSNRIGLEAAKTKALADAKVSASNVTFTEAKLDYDDGITVYDIEFYTLSYEYEYEINAYSGKIHDRDVEARKTGSGSKGSSTKEADSQNSSGSYIGVDKAKKIALDHAGLSSSDVTFSKAKLDSDDGKKVYDIEFYKGRMEYEYEIDAASGKILEYDTERDD